MRYILAPILCCVLGGAAPLLAQVPLPTTTQLSFAPSNTIDEGTLLTLTATVSATGGVNRGTVNFCFASNSTCGGSAALGTAQVNSSGIATLLLRLGVGTYSIRAEYEGTSSSQSSASVPLTVTVAGNHNLVTSTTLSATGTTGAYTLSGTVAGFGNTPLAGSVSFLDSTLNDLLIGSATLSLPIRTFAFSSTTSAPRGSVFGSLAVSDFNDDGFSDVAIVNRNTNQVFVYISNGDGTFKLSSNGFATDVSPDGVAVGDFNGDGISDLAVVSEGSGDVSVLLGVGDGTFQAPIRNSSLRGPGIAIGDFNNDGCLDVATTDNGINSVLIDLGDCTGGLQTGQSFTTDIAPVGIVTADFNSDGNMDVAVVNQGGNDISVLLGNGDGTFRAQQTYVVGTAPDSIAVADFDSDGKVDIAVANQSDNTVSVLLGNGNGTFLSQQVYTVGTAPGSLALADFNSDGKPDIAVSNQGSNNLSVLLSNGDGTFQTQEVFPVAAGPASLGLADVNGDALPDLVIGSPAHLSFMLGGQLATYSSSAFSVSGEAGSHQVFAQYPGDVSHASSNSSLVTLTAPSNAASISLTTSSNPSIFGDALIITATFGSVNGVVPTGTVTFADNGVALGVATISNSGVATISTSVLTAGSHSLVTTYSGDANFF
jgi:Bacterial Ig-like domain (group 3)/FG-GAP-like repeat